MAVQMGETPLQKEARTCRYLGIESLAEIEEETPINVGNLEKELNKLCEGKSDYDMIYITAETGQIYMRTTNKIYANIGFKHLRLRHKKRSKKDYGIEMTFLSEGSFSERPNAIYLKSGFLGYTEKQEEKGEIKISIDHVGLLLGRFRIIFKADDEYRDSYVTGYKLKEQPVEGK